MRVAREKFPLHWPTHRHPPEFWEQLGRTIAAFSFLEETLKKAILAVAATADYGEGEMRELAKWPDQHRRALTDTLCPLADVYSKVILAHQAADFKDVGVLVDDIKKVADLRNVLCHGSWRAPGADTKSTLQYFTTGGGKFDEAIDIAWLRELQGRVVNMTCRVIDSVTVLGCEFPEGAGPGEEIWSKDQ
ncbi:hypothetical protein CLD22_15575 [Rubrivivax gelatinosus]|nr:hypothetical protein [Rubrivivax gelatinosus]